MTAADVQAVILCGGRGTRLQSVLRDRPKALGEVAGRPFLDWMLEGLKAQGVQSFILCTGFGAEAIRQHMAARNDQDSKVLFSHEESPLGTGGAVRNALEHITSDTLLVLNADSWCRYGLGDFLRFHEEKGATGSVLLAYTEDRSRYGSVTLDPESRIMAFHEKNRFSGAGWINAGVYALSRHWIGQMPAGRPVSIETEFFPAMLSEGLYGWTGGRDFIDIGTPESFGLAQFVFGSNAGRETK